MNVISVKTLAAVATIAAAACFFSTTVTAQESIEAGQLPALLKNGDLLFCVAQHDNAITLSTVRNSGYAVYHVGIAWVRDDGDIQVIDASDNGVCAAPLGSFAKRYARLLVGRLNDRSGVELTVNNALSFLGRPYDDIFMLDTNEIYCSELVQLSYVNGKGERLFPLINMSFHDAQGKLLEQWVKHYTRRGMAVPEGALGTNPAQIAGSSQLKIIYKTFR